MRKHIKAVFLIPFHDNDIMQLYDTIDSIIYYINEPHYIICVNDCKKGKNKQLQKKHIQSTQIINFVPQYDLNWPQNGYGPLFCKIYQGIEYALKEFDFDYLIKLDTDALVTGRDLFMTIDDYCKQSTEKIGMLGSYRIRSDGEKRTRWKWVLYLLYLVYVKRLLSRKSLIWKEGIPKARANGYKLGESVLGGAYIITYRCIQRVVEHYPYRALVSDKLYNTRIGEDILMSLLIFASNFKIKDYGGPNDPLTIAHRYLPINKETIIERGKQIIHSVKKGLNGESEQELRAFFKNLRK